MKKITWVDFDNMNGKYAMVGKLKIASIHIPDVEKFFKDENKYSLYYGVEKLKYYGKYETSEQAMEIVEDWWNEFINKVS